MIILPCARDGKETGSGVEFPGCRPIIPRTTERAGDKKVAASTILIVDDEIELRRFLRSCLQLENYQIVEAADGEGALNLALATPPDLMILDINLPDIDGFCVCEKLREKGFRFPIIMLTGQSGVECRVKGLSIGADDYLGKPFDAQELLARVKAQLRRQEDAKTLARDLISDHWNEINEGFRLAQKFQQPLSQMPRIPGLEMAGNLLPVGRIGGDFYAVLELDAGKVGILIGDAVGKGLSASLLMAATFSLLHSLFAREKGPKEIFDRANSELRRKTPQMENYVAAFCAVWERESRVLSYCNAGHHVPILIRRKSLRHLYLNTPGFFLGAFESGNYQERNTVVEPGDKLFLYTDGLVDLRNRAGEYFNLFKAYRRLLCSFDCEIEEISRRILNAFQGFVGPDAVLADDLAYFLVEFK
jgi:sigma-B regulation protein RsbU (phosphoserine phosphatase)